MFIEKDKEFVNLSLVKKLVVDKNKIIFYFDLHNDNYTEFVFNSEKDLEKYLFTKVFPLINKLAKG